MSLQLSSSTSVAVREFRGQIPTFSSAPYLRTIKSLYLPRMGISHCFSLTCQLRFISPAPERLDLFEVPFYLIFLPNGSGLTRQVVTLVGNIIGLMLLNASFCH